MRKHLVTFRKSGFFFYISVDVIRPKRSRKYKVTFRNHVFALFPLTEKKKNKTKQTKTNVDRILSTFRKQVFLLFLLTYSDLHVEGTETLSYVPETRAFQLFSIYRALSALVIPDLSFSLQVR